MTRIHKAIFLDRDGVLINDAHWVVSIEQIQILPGVVEALKQLAGAGFKLVAVTNQPVIARGMTTALQLGAIHQHLNTLLNLESDSTIQRYYFCPHHPQATLPEYRINCECRKPKPGMLFRAANELNIDLKNSFLVGDRLSDICAGFKAGCKTEYRMSNSE